LPKQAFWVDFSVFHKSARAIIADVSDGEITIGGAA